MNYQKKSLRLLIAAALLGGSLPTAYAATGDDSGAATPPAAETANAEPAEPAAPAKSAAATGDAAPSDFFLDGVVVTSTRLPVDVFHANANINVITAEDIEKHQYQDLSEALRAVPGVDIRNYSTAGYESSSAMKINGSDGVVVLIDGVKVTSASNTFSPSSVRNLDNIERIEVLKGSASTLYGADAVGGVINIITKQPAPGVKTRLKTEVGSYNTRRFSLNNEGREKDIYWNLYYHKSRTEDFQDAHNDTVPVYGSSDNVYFKLGKKFGDKHDLSFVYDAYTSDNRYTMRNEADGIKFGDSADEKYRLNLDSKFDEKTRNSFSYLHDFNRITTDKTSVTWDGKFVYKLVTDRISDQFTRKLSDNNTLIVGGEYARETVKTYGETFNSYALFLQDQHNFTDALKLTLGLRYDNHSQYGGHFSPAANISYDFNDNTNMYVGYNQYFRTPSFYQTFNPTFGNRDLNAEKGRQEEIGFNHRFSDKFAVSAHYFWRKSTDRIAYDYAINRYGNINEATAHGWDIQAQYKFGKYYKASVGYTHLSSEDNNSSHYLPRGSWNIGLDYTHDRFNANITGKGIINRPGPGAANPSFPNSGYWIFDLATSYKINDTFKVFAKLNNMFNQYYADQTSVWDGGAPGEWWSAPGRNFMVGLEVSF